MSRTIEPIAKIYTEFPEKFGIPRQSRLADTEGTIVFEPEYRNPDALNGLSGYSHIWLIWGFSNPLNSDNWSPTVRPPKLGGNVRKGVFATRSPFRPNGLGLSVVRIKSVEQTELDGMVIKVEGVDILNGTEVFDIKPYLPYADAIPEAAEGFTENTKYRQIPVEYKQEILDIIPAGKQEVLLDILRQDPRPGFHHDETRIYGMKFGGYEVKFSVCDEVLHLLSIEKDKEQW